MFNVGGGEVLVILIVALIVLGPNKLPGAAKQVGNFLTQIRQMSNDFKRELQDAVPDEVIDLKRDLDQTQRSLRSSTIDDEIERKARERGRAIADGTLEPEAVVDGKVSSAAAAGMFVDSEADDAGTGPDPDVESEGENEAGTESDAPSSSDDDSDA